MMLGGFTSAAGRFSRLALLVENVKNLHFNRRMFKSIEPSPPTRPALRRAGSSLDMIDNAFGKKAA